MRYAQILHRLFLGSRPESPVDIETLRLKEGITAVLNLQTDDDMRAVGVVWAPLSDYYRASAIELCRVPVRDFDPSDLREKLPKCVRQLQHLLRAKHCVYLHCTLGATRSPTVAVAYIHCCQGQTLDQAATEVKARWPCSPNLEVVRSASWQDEESTSGTL